MRKTEGPASRGERLRPSLRTLLYIVSRVIFACGLIVSAWTQEVWIFALAAAVSLVVVGVDRLVAKNASFDAEVDQVLARMRAEDAQVTSRDTRASE